MLKDYLTEKPSLTTARLLLRPLTAEDVPDLCRWLGRDEIYTYWGRKASAGERDPAQLFVDPRPWVKRKPDPSLKWGVVLRETGQVIGETAVFDVENARMGCVAYRFDPEHWGRGYATEALQAAVDFVYTCTELDRLYATVDVRNVASNRVLEKCGFIREGTVRQGKMVSVYCDYHLWGMLRSDWTARKG